MHSCSRTLFLLSTLLVASQAHAQDEEPMGDPIVVTGDRPNPCELDPFCANGSLDDVIALIEQPAWTPPPPPAGGSGGGNVIEVTADREKKEADDKEKECNHQEQVAAFLAANGVPSNLIQLLGEDHGDPDNLERQKDRIQRLLDAGKKVCVGLEFGRHADPSSSQQQIYNWAFIMGVPAFNIDPSQTLNSPDICGYDEAYNDPLYGADLAGACMNLRDMDMATNLIGALSTGVDGQTCDVVVGIAGAAHTSQVVSAYLGNDALSRITIADALQLAGYIPFIDHPVLFDPLFSFCD